MMASCKDCLSYEVCEARIAADENYPGRNYIKNNNCSKFKDRTRFVELPCRVGDNIFHIADYIDGVDIKTVHHFRIVEDGVYLYSDPWDGEICQSNQVGKIVVDEYGYGWNGYFLTEDKAKKALEERENNEN